MTSDILQPERFSHLTAAEAPAPRPAPPDAAAPGGLLRALLAGVVALLVLLLPSQLASRDDASTGCRDGGRETGDGAALSDSWPRVSRHLEIRSRDIC